MDCKVYTYAPSTPRTYTRRRRAKRRRGFVWPALLLLLGVCALVFLTPSPEAAPALADRPICVNAAGLFASRAAGAIPDLPALTPPAPEAVPVDDSYFDDAVFIGDSRTAGLLLNTGLVNATSYAYQGLMVDTVFTKPLVNRDGRKIPVAEALRSTSFSKVYIMFGVNETGWVYSEIFAQKYGELIDAIRDVNPEAVIYIQEILPVSAQVSATHSYITNEKIQEYNRLLRELAQDKQVRFLETGRAVADAEGNLPEEAANDGIHLVKEYCVRWLDYLKTHTAEQEG